MTASATVRATLVLGGLVAFITLTGEAISGPKSGVAVAQTTCPPHYSGHWAGDWSSVAVPGAGGSWEADLVVGEAGELSGTITVTNSVVPPGSRVAGQVSCGFITLGAIAEAGGTVLVLFSGTIDSLGLSISGTYMAITGDYGTWQGSLVAAKSALRWPWPLGEGWGYNQGPHDYYNSRFTNGLDFQPLGISGCDPPVDVTHEVRPMAPGTIIKLTKPDPKSLPPGEREKRQNDPVSVWIRHDGGWVSYLTHLANTGGLREGQQVGYNSVLGNPSCFYEPGGGATGRHVHVALMACAEGLTWSQCVGKTSPNGDWNAIFSAEICGWRLGTDGILRKGSREARPSTAFSERGIVTNDDCPGTPAPAAGALDVFLLVDLSGSFSDDLPVFKAQAPDIVSSIRAANPDSRFGLARFEDYPIPPFGFEAAGDKAYERLVDLTFNTDLVLETISRLSTRFGGDEPESQLAALYQAATGTGQDLSGVGFPGASIPPGQQASFRDGATKLFLLWTDAPFHRPGDPGAIPYPGPSFSETVDAILGLDPPRVIGISSGPFGVSDLQEIAEATGAFAPPDGVDCDSDGAIDIAASEPLVCSIAASGEGIGQAITALVEAASVTPVNIDIKPGSDSNPISPLSAGVIPVGILSTPEFDAPIKLDKASLTFGRTGDEASLAFCSASGEDVNGDGLLDQVCHFETVLTGFQASDTEGILRGQTVDGVAIEGRDAVTIVPP